MNIPSRTRPLVLALAALLATSGACAAPAYRAHEIVGPDNVVLFPQTLNDAGATAGNTDADYPTHEDSFIRGAHGAYQQFDAAFGGIKSTVYGLNLRGDAAGQAMSPTSWIAYYKPHGKPPIDLFAGQARVSQSQANGVNASGMVVGTFTTTNDLTHAFSWQRGHITALPSLGGQNTKAFAINDAGVIVGTSEAFPLWRSTHAVKWENGGVTDMGGLGYTEDGGDMPFSVNAAGWATGYCRVAFAGVHACVWHDGVAEDVGTLDGTWSEGRSINASNVVVGRAGYPRSTGHAFVWKDGVISDLNDLVAMHGVMLMDAPAINGAGQILVLGWDGSNYRHYVLDPIVAR
jgi:probable HAF family extracellular repeat protein